MSIWHKLIGILLIDTSKILSVIGVNREAIQEIHINQDNQCDHPTPTQETTEMIGSAGLRENRLMKII